MAIAPPSRTDLDIDPAPRVPAPSTPDLSEQLAALLTTPTAFRRWLEAAHAAPGPHSIVGRADVVLGCPLATWIAEALHLDIAGVEVDTDERRSRVLVTLYAVDDTRAVRIPLTLSQRAPGWCLKLVNVIDAKAQHATVVAAEALAALDIATADGEREGSAS